MNFILSSFNFLYIINISRKKIKSLGLFCSKLHDLIVIRFDCNGNKQVLPTAHY